MSLRHMNGSAFVSNIDQLNPGGIHRHPNRHDVPTAEPEYPLDAMLAQYIDDQIRDVMLCHVLMDPQGVFSALRPPCDPTRSMPPTSL
jgi:hypothetical protein